MKNNKDKKFKKEKQKKERNKKENKKLMNNIGIILLDNHHKFNNNNKKVNCNNSITAHITKLQEMMIINLQQHLLHFLKLKLFKNTPLNNFNKQKVILMINHNYSKISNKIPTFNNNNLIQTLNPINLNKFIVLL